MFSKKMSFEKNRMSYFRKIGQKIHLKISQFFQSSDPLHTIDRLHHYIRLGKWVFLLLFQTALAVEEKRERNSAAERVWNNLQLANRSFAADPLYAAQLAKLAHHQNPHCVVIGCADSRVAPELVFRQGIGELFVVRIAGEVVDDVVIDSVEYTVSHHDTRLIVVLGHTDCGAVAGALKRLKNNKGQLEKVKGHLNAVLVPIEEAILKAKINIYAEDALSKAVRANVRYQAEKLIRASPVIAKALFEQSLAIVGAECDLSTGQVHQLFSIP